ncbi:MAG: hypothetical protein SXA11_24505 [Cyanobacteriota bacterium]|nr:hypothetical protein [Cyanobacteriota bacterium]
MKIRCIANTGASLREDYLDPDGGYTRDLEFGLTIGKEYVVYAFYEWEGQVWYYICDDHKMYYPMQNPAPLFEVVDKRVSKYWQFDLRSNGLLRVAFSQWFTVPYFYDKLTDKEPEEVEIFNKIKALMDLEAETPPEATEETEKELATYPV